MYEAITSLPPATAPIRHASETGGSPDRHEIFLNELWENKDKEISFSDVLDIVNPLQHIPIVTTVYRMLTGDEISQGARMVGATLYGGPLGLMGAGIVVAFEETTGKKFEGHIASIFNDSPDKAEQIAASSNRTVGEVSGNTHNSIAANTTAPAGPAQFSQTDGQKILQFLSDRKEATQQVLFNTISEKKQLSEAILKAQRAQTDLLLAHIVGKANSGASVAPFFKPHSYMLPRGAPPALVAKAMEPLCKDIMRSTHKGLPGHLFPTTKRVD